MASFGAKYPHFSKIKTEPDDALPTYEGPVNIGRLVKADLTVNLASGKLYADDELAESVPDANGIYFVPAFTGLGAPYWDMYARGCIVGLTRGVNRAHIARSVLEAIAYQMTDLLEAMEDDSGITFTELRVDGGASVSDILLQIQSDMIRTIVDRPKTVETTALGAAYLAGLAVGYWKDRDEIAQNREIEKIFTPQMEKSHRDELYKGWKRAVERSRDWAKD